ncbi:MAG: hypothetical protein NTU44_20165 [Bacteroidetes bacterium]|nr:hypothetical protein [Bacteroidota bacterium]
MKRVLLTLTLFAFIFGLNANNLQISNVTLTGDNTTNHTIQVRFNISWENSWRDAINYDAAWIFIKFKDADGAWQHAKLSTTGFMNPTGTASTLQVTNDHVGSYIYRTTQDTGNFAASHAELQWQYGDNGVANPLATEIRVFGVEMVYIPEGDFCTYNLYIGSGTAVIKDRLSPPMTSAWDGSTLFRVHGSEGMDSNNDGIIENPNYPTGYRPFYIFKYELTEGQYADFYNTLSELQRANIGLAGSTITLQNQEYFASVPNRVCGGANAINLMSYADWAGLRPMSNFEFNKAGVGPFPYVPLGYYGDEGFAVWGSTYFRDISGLNGPENGTETTYSYSGKPNYSRNGLVRSGIFATATSSREQAGASYYGVMEMVGNAKEPIMLPHFFGFQGIQGDGSLDLSGYCDVEDWNEDYFTYTETVYNTYWNPIGFRLVRSAE